MTAIVNGSFLIIVIIISIEVNFIQAITISLWPRRICCYCENNLIFILFDYRGFIRITFSFPTIKLMISAKTSNAAETCQLNFIVW
ncbi:hypothetical protein CEG88_15535 [Klebsiella aerogenes]|nr:hypothetical protein AWI35_22935 [Klebsiella aerogenes]OWP42310.1 hypothetical protein CEG88_15535 [Klebsiella aerogenes]